MAGTLALPATYAPRIAKAMQEGAKRTPLIWLEFQDCAGDSESFLRASRPTAADVVLDVLSVDYHETIMAPSGKLAEKSKADTIAAGGYLVVVEGSIPRKDDGIYCCIGGRTAIDIMKEAASNAAAIISVGSCASFGGIPKVSPNPTDAVGVDEIITDKPIINLPGCPMNVVNLTAVVVHFITFGKLPDTDDLKRPLFAHGQLIHDNCERRGHFVAGEFVKAWGDEGHRLGWCLYEMGCKGPVAKYNCPTVRWNDGMSWPVAAGHGCMACATPDFFERPIYEPVLIQEATPPNTYPSVSQPGGGDSSSGLALGAAGGFIVGAGVAGAIAATRSKSDAAS
jgi:hydrogenase small subunit